MKLSFPISAFIVHAYFSQYLKNFCIQICKKTLGTTHNLFNNWGKIKVKR